MNYLVSYRPLVMNKMGKWAISRFDFPPYVDYSCRREPDFESEFPSITALCRGTKFAPRLKETDVAVYMTVKRKYPGCPSPHRRLTAILKVLKRFKSHEVAAEWYQEKGLKLPSNCVVRENPPLALEKTSNPCRYCRVESWDASYRKRSRKTGVFLVCKALFLELHSPPAITDQMLCAVFGRIPGTQNPGAISDLEYKKLTRLVGVS